MDKKLKNANVTTFKNLGLLYIHPLAEQSQILRQTVRWCIHSFWTNFTMIAVHRRPCKMLNQRNTALFDKFSSLGLMCPPFADHRQICHARTNSWSTYVKISSGSVYCGTLEERKTQILLHFQLQYCVLAPPIGIETKLNARIHLQFSSIQRYRDRL